MATNESLRQHLAEKVMGWGWPLYIDNWKPDENIEQAFMCLETFQYYRIIKRELISNAIEYYCVVSRDCEYKQICETESTELPMAISLACARATGYEDT